MSSAATASSRGEYDRKMVEEIIEEGLFDKLASPHKNWIEMGFALYNTFGDTDGWLMFDAFSQRAPAKYDADKNREWWDKMTSSIQPENILTIKSIVKWARDEDRDMAMRLQEKYKKQKARAAKSSASDEEEETYKAVFAKMAPEFQLTHAKIIENGVYIKEKPDEVIVFSPDKFRSAYSHMECGLKSGWGKKLIPDQWVSSVCG
jgi:hypothetical protein